MDHKRPNHQRQIERLLLANARLTARNAVLMQAIAAKARKGEQEWAVSVMERADRAALAVRREDLVVAGVQGEIG
jgi:ATP-dependent DNA ligase